MSEKNNLCNLSTLHESVKDVFNTMIFMDISSEPLENELHEEQASLMGSISFRGLYDGVLSIQCSASCAREITMNLLAMDEDEELQPSDIPDAVGEVVNMTMGSLKTKFYDQLGEISVSIPTVVRGASLSNALRAGEVKLSTALTVCDQYSMQVDLVHMYSGGE